MFEQLAEYTIPVLHPVVVHFPIALSLMALFTAGIWLFRNTNGWWRTTLLLQLFAAVGALMAVRTGEVMEEQSEGVMMVDQFVEYHETLGERALWLLVVSVVVLLGVRWMGGREVDHAGVRLRWRLLAFVVVLSAVVAVWMTAHVGGIMTWGVPN